MTIYIFKPKSKEGHLSLDTGKRVKYNETIDLDEKELEKSGIKEMIKSGILVSPTPVEKVLKPVEDLESKKKTRRRKKE